MFKSILPSRRVPSADFQMLTNPPFSEPNGKENCYPHLTSAANERYRTEKQKKSKGKDMPMEGVVTTEAFDRLLDDLQIPSTLRPKLAGMDATVKAAMLKSSQVLATSKPPTLSPRGVRRARSTDSLQSQTRHSREQSELMDGSKGLPSFMTTGYARGTSFNFASQANLLESEAVPPLPKPVKEKRSKTAGKPEKWCKILESSSSIRLEVETVKKLRLLLRNEAASWTEEFLLHGGYDALLARLKEILGVEWREEQHDDQILHELLRCFKALSTSAVGCAALRSRCPTPYSELVTLLYSDKKPGEVGTRQLVVELLLVLFELYPPSALPSAGSPIFSTVSRTHARTQSVPWERSLRSPVQSSLVTLPAPYDTLFAFVRSLLLTPAPPKAEQTGIPVEPHEFIEELHRPRVFKTYMQELSDLCRDYFWVFCHPSNTVWNLDETDENKVEKPRAPGGMTGGVEFEAMGYMTTHFRFLNAVSTAAQDLNLPNDHEHSAYRFHSDMFLSGMERVLLVARKASVTYYPTLHLEIARYVSAVGRAGFELPWSLSRIIGSPPSNMRNAVVGRAQVQNLGKSSLPVTGSAPASPMKRQREGTAAGTYASGLPAVRNVTPMFH